MSTSIEWEAEQKLHLAPSELLVMSDFKVPTLICQINLTCVSNIKM